MNPFLAALSLVFFFGVGQTCAAENITGAFGLSFSEAIDHSNLKGFLAPQDDLSNTFYFEPTSPYPLFSKYMVEIDLTTNKPVRITGTGGGMGRRMADRECDIVVSTLKAKYGLELDIRVNNAKERIQRITDAQGNYIDIKRETFGIVMARDPEASVRIVYVSAANLSALRARQSAAAAAKNSAWARERAAEIQSRDTGGL